MIKHTLEIAERPASVYLRNQQLVIESGEGEDKIRRSFACEDIGVLILQHPGIFLSSAVAMELLKNGSAILFSDAKHLPAGLLLPTTMHSELVPRMQAQISASEPTRKRMWKAVVEAKIREQRVHLTERNATHDSLPRLLRLEQSVRSGDPENHEAQAARIYWSACFPQQYAEGDRRLPEGTSLFNALLNYGYAIIRAAVARALVASGLQPALGVFHSRRDNPFCLADDLMEPLRPLVDRVVAKILENESNSSERLERRHRQPLLQLLASEVSIHSFRGPLMVALSRYTSGFQKCLVDKDAPFDYPKLLSCTSADINACG